MCDLIDTDDDDYQDGLNKTFSVTKPPPARSKYDDNIKHKRVTFIICIFIAESNTN